MIALGIAPAKWVRFLSVAHSPLTASALTSAELPAEGVGVCWGALGCWPGNSRALEPPDASDSTAGLWRGSRSAAADARASAVPRAGSGTGGVERGGVCLLCP